MLMMIAMSALLAGAPAAQPQDSEEQTIQCEPAKTADARFHSPTNEEINAAEINNPDSTDYKDRPAPGSDQGHASAQSKAAVGETKDSSAEHCS